MRASTSAHARVLAAAMERRELGHMVPVGNESHSFRSGFESEKLYWVTRVNPAAEPAFDPDGLPKVLRASTYPGLSSTRNEAKANPTRQVS